MGNSNKLKVRLYCLDCHRVIGSADKCPDCGLSKTDIINKQKEVKKR